MIHLLILFPKDTVTFKWTKETVKHLSLPGTMTIWLDSVASSSMEDAEETKTASQVRKCASLPVAGKVSQLLI